MPNKIRNQHEVVAKKRFGQNFLHDERVLDRIVSEAQVDKDTFCTFLLAGQKCFFDSNIAVSVVPSGTDT